MRGDYYIIMKHDRSNSINAYADAIEDLRRIKRVVELCSSNSKLFKPRLDWTDRDWIEAQIWGVSYNFDDIVHDATSFSKGTLRHLFDGHFFDGYWLISEELYEKLASLGEKVNAVLQDRTNTKMFLTCEALKTYEKWKEIMALADDILHLLSVEGQGNKLRHDT